MEISIRQPEIEDGKQIWSLIKHSGNLDLNSEYCYFMLSDIFGKQCALACSEENEILGYASCLPRPTSPKVLFVWQICVDEKAQKHGIAKKLLNFIIQNQEAKVDEIQATISGSNIPSQTLFKSLAKDYKAKINKEIYIQAQNFSNGHESEFIYKIEKLKY